MKEKDQKNPLPLTQALPYLLHRIINLTRHVRRRQATSDAKQHHRVPPLCSALQICDALWLRGVGNVAQR